MDESEIKNVVDKMTKKFKMGGFLSNGMPIGNKMIISKEATYKPRPVVSDEMIDSVMRAENKARAEQLQRESTELVNRLFQTHQELNKKRGNGPVINKPFVAPVTNSNPVYKTDSRNIESNADGGIMKCLKGGKTYAECKKCGGKTPVVKNQEPTGPMKIKPEVEPSGFFKRMF